MIIRALQQSRHRRGLVVHGRQQHSSYGRDRGCSILPVHVGFSDAYGREHVEGTATRPVENACNDETHTPVTVSKQRLKHLSPKNT